MADVIETSKAERAIKDAEIRLRTLEVSLDDVQKEVYRLQAHKITLEDNIKFLKARAIVASTAEFKKIKADLAAVSARLKLFLTNKNDHEKAKKQLESYLLEAKKKYDKLTASPENNVFFYNFGDQDGQE